MGFQATAQVVPETGLCLVTVIRTFGSTGPIQVSYATADGTGVNGVDYTGVSGTLTWVDGDATSRTIAVPVIRTSGITDKTFTITLSNVAPFLFSISPATTTITIRRQGYGELDFVGAAYQVQDPDTGTATVTLQVQRFNGFKGAVGCSFHTADGTAVAGLDYTAASGTLAWADGEGGTKNVSVTILGRSGGQGSRSFTVTIDTPTGSVAIGLTNVATTTIVEGSPSTNPVAGGSIPEILFDDMLNDSFSMQYRTLILSEDLPVSRRNVQFGAFLGLKIGTVIGFPPATDSFGGGTDPANNDSAFGATPRQKTRIRRMNYRERV